MRTKEKLAAVGEMAAQLAHEIRNPLGSIRGSAQVLMGEPALGEEQGRLLDIISRESKRLVGHAQPLPVPGAAARPARTSPVDLRPVLESAVTLLRNGAELWPEPRGRLRGGRRAARLPGRRRPDRAGLLEPRAQRPRGDARRGPARGAPAARRAETSCSPCATRAAGMGRDEQRRMFEPLPGLAAWGPASASRSCSASCASTAATSPCAARRERGRRSTSACRVVPAPGTGLPRRERPRLTGPAARGSIAPGVLA